MSSLNFGEKIRRNTENSEKYSGKLEKKVVKKFKIWKNRKKFEKIEERKSDKILQKIRKNTRET